MLHPMLIKIILLRQSCSRQRGERSGGIPSWLFASTVLFLLSLAGLAQAATPAPPSINTNLIFDVTNTVFAGGALGNGVSNSAAAINAAISMASTSIVAGLTGGTVRVRAVGTFTNYLSGPINLKNNVNLLIDAGTKLQMLPFGSYPTNPSPPAFISGSSLHDIELSGSGTIDGQGLPWWNAYNANKALARPGTMFAPSSCSRVWVENVTLQNPPNTHMSFHTSGHTPCGDVTVTNITINTPDGTPNTDGIDLAATNALVISSYISDGDDHIAMGDSSAFDHDIVITNCTFGTGHGVSIGSFTGGGLSNLLVVNCSWTAGNGIRLKSERGRGGLVQGLTYLNLTMSNVSWPILIYSYYNYGEGTLETATPSFAASDPPQTVTSSTPIWRNITFSNVTATTTGGYPPIMIWGLPEMLVSNVTLDQVNISGANNCEIYNSTAIRFLDSQITLSGNINTFVLYNAQLTVTNSAASANRVTIGGLAVPPTNNALGFFNRPALVTDTNELGAGSITLGGSTLSFRQSAVTFSNNLNTVSASTLILSNGTYTLGGALTGPGPLTVTLTNSGALRFNQGVNAWGGSNAIFSAGSSGTINNHSASTISIFLGALSGGSGAELQGSDQTGPGVDTYVIGNLSSNTTFGGTITNGTSSSSPHVVALVEVGNGTFTLSGANSYSGGTTVSNGTLLVNNTSGSGTGMGAVSVVSGGTLGGTGVVAGPVTVNGTLSPGNSPGTLTVSNNLVVGSGAVLQYQLGTNSDLTVVSGNLILDGALNITNAGGFTNATYILFTYGGTLTTNGSPTILAIGSTPDMNKTYTIDISTAGLVNLIVSNSVAPPLDPFVAWQLQYFGCTNCAQAAAGADPFGKGMSNTNQFLAGLNPTNPASALQIISAAQQGSDVLITWTTAGAHTNAVQATAGDGNGGYATNFTDISSPIIITGSGDATTNYTDAGGATNSPSRYYRVRLVP
jgi:polygalacturonase